MSELAPDESSAYALDSSARPSLAALTGCFQQPVKGAVCVCGAWCRDAVQSPPRAQGPVIAKVMPGVWMLTNIVRPCGSQQAPANSLLR